MTHKTLIPLKECYVAEAFYVMIHIVVDIVLQEE